jgi:hypothetical protein
MDPRQWRFRLLAGTIALLLLGLAAGPIGLFGVVVVAAALMAILAVVAMVPRPKPDPYDLSELRRIHEREELRSLRDGLGAAASESVYCLMCSQPYDARFPTCPHCIEKRR